jgi:hypothetical protein
MAGILFRDKVVEQSRGPRVQIVDDPRRGDSWQSNGRFPRIAVIRADDARSRDRACFDPRQSFGGLMRRYAAPPNLCIRRGSADSVNQPLN